MRLRSPASSQQRHVVVFHGCSALTVPDPVPERWDFGTANGRRVSVDDEFGPDKQAVEDRLRPGRAVGAAAPALDLMVHSLRVGVGNAVTQFPSASVKVDGHQGGVAPFVSPVGYRLACWGPLTVADPSSLVRAARSVSSPSQALVS